MPTALVTGAGRGVGLALTEALGRAGWTVLAGMRDDAAAQALSRIDGDVAPISLDVADPASVSILAERLRGMPLDLLVNNAGILIGRGVRIGGEPFDFEEFRTSLEVNTLAPLRMVEAFLDHLRAGEQRKILTISSQMGSIERSPGGSYWYRTSKAAVNALMRNVARDLSEEGFCVTLAHPGWVQTDMGGQEADITVQESAEGLFRLIGRMGPELNGGFYSWTGEPHPF